MVGEYLGKDDGRLGSCIVNGARLTKDREVESLRLNGLVQLTS